MTMLNKTETLANLPPEWPVSLLPQVQAQVRASNRKIVVLDDDPTGTQTVYDIPVLTEWSVETLAQELLADSPAFYLLTNSRSLPLPQAQAINAAIGRNLLAAAQQTGRDFAVVSRSDSTLRGHFPGEVEALAEALGQHFDAWLLIPFFLEGGRYTINDIHYVAEGELLIPAGETPFAQDKVFGYRSSDLKEWVAEKTFGVTPAETVASITIDDIRRGGPERVAEKLSRLAGGTVCVVNAASYRDIGIVVSGLLQAEAQGRQFLYRTAASFVRVRAGLGPRPLLTPAELHPTETGGGLIIVGSYVPKTTTQVEALLAQTTVTGLEINVEALLDDNRRAAEIERVADQAGEILGQNRDVMLYTSRQLITGDDAAASLSLGQRVSDSLVRIVRAISTRPRYLLAKGGITASDVATQGLGIKKATVLGQILPGVPVWQAGPESRYPGLTYIVFPGNVGGPEALADIATMFKT